MKDSYIVDYLKQYGDSFPAWLNAADKTHHIWRGFVSQQNLEAGFHTLSIQAQDRGKSWQKN